MGQLDDDLDAAVADAEGHVEVTLGGTTVWGIPGRASELAGDPRGPQTRGIDPWVYVRREALPGLAQGAALIVDGVSWKVREIGEGPDFDARMVTVFLTAP